VDRTRSLATTELVRGLSSRVDRTRGWQQKNSFKLVLLLPAACSIHVSGKPSSWALCLPACSIYVSGSSKLVLLLPRCIAVSRVAVRGSVCLKRPECCQLTYIKETLPLNNFVFYWNHPTEQQKNCSPSWSIHASDAKYFDCTPKERTTTLCRQERKRRRRRWL